MPGFRGNLNKEKYCFKNSNFLQTQRPYSDIYGEFPNQLQKSTSTSNIDSNCDFSKVRNQKQDIYCYSVPMIPRNMSLCIASWEFWKLFLDVPAKEEQEGECAAEGETPEHDDDPGGSGAGQRRSVHLAQSLLLPQEHQIERRAIYLTNYQTTIINALCQEIFNLPFNNSAVLRHFQIYKYIYYLHTDSILW